jgi:hypothetical protein
MNELMSPSAFKWVQTIVPLLLAVPWFIYDTINLIRARTLDRRVPENRDRQFGYVIGMIAGAIGVIGVLRFQDLL